MGKFFQVSKNGYWSEEVKVELKKVGAHKHYDQKRKKSVLVTKDHKEVLFRIIPHWGNPPAHYREIITQFHKESERLRRKVYEQLRSILEKLGTSKNKNFTFPSKNPRKLIMIKASGCKTTKVSCV